MGKNGGPESVDRSSSSFLNTGIGEAYRTTYHDGDTSYTGRSEVSQNQADKNADENYQKGNADD